MAITKPTKPNTFATGIAYSADVNENFDVAYAKVDEIIDNLNNAAGSTLSTADRLAVSMNADGTMKEGITSGGEWINAAFTLLYVSATSFTAAGNQAAVFTENRRVKVTLSGSTVYSQIVSANYSAISGLTTVVIADSVLTNPLTSVEHGVVSPLASNGSVSPATIGAATAAQGVLADAALPAANYTAADVLNKLLTVDADGSGLNATTLQGAAPATTATADKIAKRDGTGKLAGDILGNAATATNATNHINSFDQSLSDQGYQLFPSGLIIQWGSATENAGTETAFVFPAVFPTACVAVIPSHAANSNGYIPRASDVTTSGFTMKADIVAPGAPNPSTKKYYVAIGF